MCVDQIFGLLSELLLFDILNQILEQVTQEKNELKDETIVLMSEIEKMRSAQSQSHEQQPMYVISPTSQDTHVRRPHPRRATPLDPWQHRILTRATELTGEEEEEEEEREQAGKITRELQLLD